MRKFKLIKEYPGSDHEGIIVSLKTPNGLYEGYQYNYYSKHVENNPEYWEEVIEKDYEIISYIKKGSTTCTTTKRRGGENHKEYWNIHAVKRLSDGEVFIVGDRITGYHKDVRSIQTIKICPYTGIIRLEQSGGYTDLNNATKAKNPIFLTHDGKDIFEGDKVWYVNKENFYYDYFQSFLGITFRSDLNAYFLTREEAEDYIIENKPALSIKEFWEITCMSTSNFNKNTYMKDLVKKRSNLK
jgi:hypothetical protein